MNTWFYSLRTPKYLLGPALSGPTPSHTRCSHGLAPVHGLRAHTRALASKLPCPEHVLTFLNLIHSSLYHPQTALLHTRHHTFGLAFNILVYNAHYLLDEKIA